MKNEIICDYIEQYEVDGKTIYEYFVMEQLTNLNWFARKVFERVENTKTRVITRETRFYKNGTYKNLAI